MIESPSLPAREPSEERALLELIARVDDLLERVQRERRSLARAMEIVLPEVAARTGARGAFVHTFGEDLALRTFVWPPELATAELAALVDERDRDRARAGAFPLAADVAVVQPLDVAGEWFGCAGLVLAPERAPEAARPALRASLRVVCEQLDNYLHGIRTTREKHRLTSALAHALQRRVLSDGLGEAARVVAEVVPIDKLLVVLRADRGEGAAVHLQLYEGARRVLDTMDGSLSGALALDIAREARAYVESGDRAILARLGLEGAREEVLIHGVQETTLVGKVCVTSRAGDFDTFDRELLSELGDVVCQRVVDFSKEYKNLARSFRSADVDRMLRTSDYVERWLLPREREVAMLYVDISGFTRVCEQVLVDPRRIGRLVDLWGERAVQILWEHGGVFDKMVGDCVIGLFGPPFYERSAREDLSAAIDAAVAIRAMTNALPEEDELAVLRSVGLGVSTGVHHAPLFVGLFGPNENFTGFSAGMNNTARLQAQAARDEILVMDDAIRVLGPEPPYDFGELRSARVKNVADPLVFRPVLGRR